MISNLQILRGLSALGVVFYHTDLRLAGGWHTEFFGVSTFFVISGSIMCFVTRNPEGGDHTAGRFIVRRAIGIVPLYWLATFAWITLFNRPPITRHLDPIMGWVETYVPHILRSLFFVPSDTFPVLGVGWTLNFEIYFYALFAMGLLVSRTLAPLIAAVVIFAVINANNSGVDNWLIKYYSHADILFFLQGILLFYIWWVTKDDLEKSPIHVRMLIIVACGLVVAFVYGSQFIAPQQDLFAGGSAEFPLLLVAAAIFAASAGADITWRPLVLIGDASYAIYLTHEIVMTQLDRVTPIWKENLWPALLVVVIATAIGIVVHILIEKPILRLIRNGFRVRKWVKSDKMAVLVAEDGAARR